jgi:hypothetical protein
MKINITFSSCWYKLKSKFNTQTYESWFKNMLSNVNNYYLVIYTNEESFPDIQPHILNNDKIKVIIKNFQDFYFFKYKTNWKRNHKHSILSNRIDWKLNMLWSEKIAMVKDTIDNKYFDTDYYGWCDIGYFRGRNVMDSPCNRLINWPNSEKINQLNKDTIHYAIVNNNDSYINNLVQLIMNKNDLGLPAVPIPQEQISVAGGFFILYKDNINWWLETFENKLKLYFNNSYVVKDDQIIIIDCIINNLDKFSLYKEISDYDNWFMFQRLLM